MARAAFTKRVDLNGLYDGWDEGCYAIVRSMTYQERRDIASIDTESTPKEELLEKERNLVVGHLVTGKVKFYDTEKDEYVLDALTPEVIEESSELIEKLFTDIAGLTYDPKGSGAAAPSVSPQPSPSPTTENSSSTGAPAESR